MTFSVTAKHIKNGKRFKPTKCPVALALKEATGKTIKVGSSMAYFGVNNTSLNKKLTAFISRFDDGEIVKPAKFTINLKPLGL